MQKISCFLLAATTITLIVGEHPVAANSLDLQAKANNSPSQNPKSKIQNGMLLVGNQQLQSEFQALEGAPEEQASETLEGAPEEQELEEQDLEQKEEELDRELQIEQRNPEEPTVEEVPGPGEELGIDGIDDNLPVQPPDEEIEINF